MDLVTVKDNQSQVVITGLGIVSSLGYGVSSFRDALLNGHSHFIHSAAYPVLTFPVLGAFILDFDILNYLDHFYLANDKRQAIEKMIRQLPHTALIALFSSIEAWLQAAADRNPVDPDRTAIIIAAQNTSSNYQYQLRPTFDKTPSYLSPSYVLHFMDTDCVGIISEILNIRGEGFTVGGASASGNIALLRAYQLIQDKRQDACLVVGEMADLSPMELQGFYNIGALGGHSYVDQPNQACRPFDKKHEGFIYGQATACIMLESLASAQKRGVPILAYFLGGALLLDAHHLPHPLKEGEIKVMQKAIANAGININDINYINTHGTASPLGDEIEIEAIQAVLGERNQAVMINSTKSITGHCLWSAGIVEAVATVIQMQEKFVHPNLNLDNPITEKSLFASKQGNAFTIDVALSNGFGFGGINTSLVFANAHQ